MNILISPDSFKESLSAKQVSLAVERGIKKAFPSFVPRIIFMADGGEGSVQTLVDHTKGSMVKVDVCDPLLRPVVASYGILGDGKTAVIESASAIGLSLLKADERNPFKTSSNGVGLLIRHAVEAGYRKLIVCIGGTSTNDGGVGMLQAMGCKLLNCNGDYIGAGNRALADLHAVDSSEMNDLLDGCELTVASDVTNVLLGEQGASYVFAKQKGASASDLPLLDANMRYYADAIIKAIGKDFTEYLGAGAAGGIGFALMAFADAKMRKGVELIAELLDVEKAISEADIIFTGEGSVDSQTSFGKVVQGVALIANKYGKPAVALCGSKAGDVSELHKAGLTAVFSITDSPMTLTESMSNADSLLEKQAEEIIRLFASGTQVAKKL